MDILLEALGIKRQVSSFSEEVVCRLDHEDKLCFWKSILIESHVTHQVELRYCKRYLVR